MPRGDVSNVSDGLEHVVAAETVLSKVDGEAGVLILRGHYLQDIAGRRSFEWPLPQGEALGSLLVQRVFARDVFTGVVLQHRGSHDADHRTDGDVDGNGHPRVIAGEQCGRNQWRGTTGNDRSKLVTDRCTRIAHAAGEALGYHGRLRA